MELLRPQGQTRQERKAFRQLMLAEDVSARPSPRSQSGPLGRDELACLPLSCGGECVGPGMGTTVFESLHLTDSHWAVDIQVKCQ